MTLTGTSEEIEVRNLRSEAAMAGDTEMVALCDAVLLDGDHDAWMQVSRVLEEVRRETAADLAAVGL